MERRGKEEKEGMEVMIDGDHCIDHILSRARNNTGPAIGHFPSKKLI